MNGVQKQEKMVFQEPMTSLNPYHRIGDQITESIILHTDSSKKEAVDEAKHLLNLVEIDDVDRALRLALSDYNIGSDTYLRGDVLLQDTVTEIFRFYDLTNSLFTEARPGNPYVIEEIRDFVDPIRPNMVFYPLNVFLDSNLLFIDVFSYS